MFYIQSLLRNELQVNKGYKQRLEYNKDTDESTICQDGFPERDYKVPSSSFPYQATISVTYADGHSLTPFIFILFKRRIKDLHC